MSTKRQEVARSRSRWREVDLLEKIADVGPTRGFGEVLLRQKGSGRAAVIAEIKRASPSKGRIFPGDDADFDPVRIGRGYQDQGACCVSCLTDRDYFQGDDHFLALLRKETTLPLLRKDFLYDPYQVLQSRALGADAVLLIMAVLSPVQALELEAAAMEVGLDVLAEVHDEGELDAAHDLKTPFVGINNRNLKTFATSLDRCLELAGRVEVGRVVVAESGINTGNDLKMLMGRGIWVFLVGTAFMRHSDPGAALGRMLVEASS